MASSKFTYVDYLKTDDEFKKYGKNGSAIFALAMYLGIDDVDDFYSNSWTEDEDEGG